MAYCTQSDVEDACGGAARLLQLSDWDRNGAVDAARVAKAIDRASSLIDSFAVKRYAVPINPIPAVIVSHAADLAMLFLAKGRGMLTQDQQELWTSIAGTDENNPGWLLLLARGTVSLGVDPVPTASSMVVDQVATTLPLERDMSRDKSGGFW